MADVPVPTPRRSRGPLIAGATFVLAVVAIPLLILFFVLPWLSQLAFTSVDELNIAEIEELSIQLLNHPSVDDKLRKPDVDMPIRSRDRGVKLAAADFDAALAPLRNATKIDAIPASTFLGEYKVRFKDGRRGTIRLRFQPGMADPLNAPVWFEIGPNKYRASTLMGPLWATAEDCATRGLK